MYQGDLREGMLFHRAEERFPDGEDPGDVMGVFSYPSGPKKYNFLYSDISQIVRVRQDGTTTPLHTPGDTEDGGSDGGDGGDESDER